MPTKEDLVLTFTCCDSQAHVLAVASKKEVFTLAASCPECGRITRITVDGERRSFQISVGKPEKKGG